MNSYTKFFILLLSVVIISCNKKEDISFEKEIDLTNVYGMDLTDPAKLSVHYSEISPDTKNYCSDIQFPGIEHDGKLPVTTIGLEKTYDLKISSEDNYLPGQTVTLTINGVKDELRGVYVAMVGCNRYFDIPLTSITKHPTVLYQYELSFQLPDAITGPAGFSFEMKPYDKDNETGFASSFYINIVASQSSNSLLSGYKWKIIRRVDYSGYNSTSGKGEVKVYDLRSVVSEGSGGESTAKCDKIINYTTEYDSITRVFDFRTDRILKEESGYKRKMLDNQSECDAPVFYWIKNYYTNEGYWTYDDTKKILTITGFKLHPCFYTPGYNPSYSLEYRLTDLGNNTIAISYEEKSLLGELYDKIYILYLEKQP